MTFDEFYGILEDVPAIKWDITRMSNNPYCSNILRGEGTVEGLYQRPFDPLSAVYWAITGDYLPPPNYFYSPAAKHAGGVVYHSKLEATLGINRVFGRRISIATFDWDTSELFDSDIRAKLLEATHIQG